MHAHTSIGHGSEVRRVGVVSFRDSPRVAYRCGSMPLRDQRRVSGLEHGPL
jgi:hypothetical protein